MQATETTKWEEMSSVEMRAKKRFRKYTRSVCKSRGKNICIECTKYGDVEATLSGKLQIATVPPNTLKDQLGLLRDAWGKIVGKSGWGHPVPFAKIGW
jgi:hypothetical protein